MSGNIKGRSALSLVDFYRRVPKDLTEATSLGAAMLISTLVIMAILFSESFAFAKARLDNSEPQLRLNFNITLLDLHCDYVSIDVWDSLGTNRQNVTKNIEKWQLDKAGQRRVFSGRNRDMREVKHEEHEETLEELHEDGEHVVPLKKDTFKNFMQEHEIAFVDLFAPWCVWCQRLAPTWEKFAEEVEDENMPIGVGSVDCVAEADLCRQERVMAFPTLRWYQNGKAVLPDYKMDRTVAALLGFAKRKLEMSEKYKDWEKKEKDPEKNPGCQVLGHLMVNRVPGNIHIEAKSKSHNLNDAMTNLTHRVNRLSFGQEGFAETRHAKRVLKQVPPTSPTDDKLYPTTEFHQVVSNHFQMGTGWLLSYQFLEQSQVVHYDVVNVPEVRFSYDLSPAVAEK